MRPIPPGELFHPLGDFVGDTLLDDLSWNANGNCVRRHVTRDYSIGPYDRAVADGHARHDDRAMTNPGVVADGDGMLRTPGEELGVVLGVFEVPGRAIGEVMERREIHRMTARIDAHVSGDIGELADPGVGDLGVLNTIRVVAHDRVADVAALADLRVFAEGRTSHRCREIDPRRLIQTRHAALRTENMVTSMMRLATAWRTSSSWKIPTIATPACCFSSIMSTTPWRLEASREAVGSSSS